ncbi:MAG TPA: nuclear transport factor 2 family protein [Longimicrobium sp.]|nr:nuclear transport factor 2 family protein [Longimicrobium sp.]
MTNSPALAEVPEALGAAFVAGDRALAAKTAEQENVERMQRLFGMIAAERFEELRELLTDDVTLEIVAPDEMPWVRAATGPDDVAAAVAANFRAVREQRPELVALVAQGDKVMVMGRESGRVAESGEPYRVLLAQQYDFRDGRLAAFRSVSGYLPDAPA